MDTQNNIPNWFAPMAAPSQDFQKMILGQQPIYPYSQQNSPKQPFKFTFDADKAALASSLSFQGLSDLTGNIDSNRNMKRYYSQLRQNNVPQQSYFTQQDLYGNQYMDEGGEINILKNKLDKNNSLYSKLTLPGNEEDDYEYARYLKTKMNKDQEKLTTLEEHISNQQREQEMLEREKAAIERTMSKFKNNEQDIYNFTPTEASPYNSSFESNNSYNSSYIPSIPLTLKAPPPISSNEKDIITKAALKHNVPPQLLYGLYGAESSFGRAKNQVSSAGAQGPFQFMPATAREYGIDPYNFEQAANAAAKYISKSYTRFKDWDKAIGSYNAGPGNIQKGIIPKETREYIPKVKHYAKYF